MLSTTATTTRSVKPNCTSAHPTSRRATNVWRANKLRPKSRPTIESNISRWYRPGWGRYTQADPFTLAPTFAYALANPVGLADPLGLYVVDDQIKQVTTGSLSSVCPPDSGGACTVGVFANLSCTCSASCGGGFQAEATLHLKGTMYVFGGPFRSLKQKPFDKTVVDRATAIAHEYNWHINLAIKSVEPEIQALEARTYGSKEECEISCADTGVDVTQRFITNISRSQAIERARRDPRKEF